MRAKIYFYFLALSKLNTKELRPESMNYLTYLNPSLGGLSKYLPLTLPSRNSLIKVQLEVTNDQF